MAENQKENFSFEKALSNLEKVLKLDATKTNEILKLFVKEIVIYDNAGIINIEMSLTAPLSTVLRDNKMGCPGLEPGTCGLRVRRSAN